MERTCQLLTLFEQLGGPACIAQHHRDLAQGEQSHDNAPAIAQFPRKLQAFLQPGTRRCGIALLAGQPAEPDERVCASMSVLQILVDGAS